MNIVTALQCEADPLIDHYDLDGIQEDRPFRIYRNEDLHLIVTGIGKTASAAATAYLQQVTGDHDYDGWLNVGLAGHPEKPVGSGLLGVKIKDRTTGKSWYPQPVFDTDLPGEPILTVARPETDYEEAFAYDMEAAGFYPTALRFSTAEIVHAFKIVSDTPESSMKNLNREMARDLVRNQMDSIAELLNSIRNLSDELHAITEPGTEYEEFLERWHFSVSRRRKLKKLLKRYRAVNNGTPADAGKFEQIEDAGTVLDQLENKIESTRTATNLS